MKARWSGNSRLEFPETFEFLEEDPKLVRGEGTATDNRLELPFVERLSPDGHDRPAPMKLELFGQFVGVAILFFENDRIVGDRNRLQGAGGQEQALVQDGRGSGEQGKPEGKKEHVEPECSPLVVEVVPVGKEP